MRLYGEANDVQGLATGPIETRFARLRENTAADTLIVWTTPGRWATGEGLSLRFPQLHLEFTCSLGEGHLLATKVAQVLDDARPPDREAGAVGVVVQAERIPLPPEDADASEPDVGVDTLEQHFAQLAGRRWGGFAAPLSAALEAEAREDEARTQRLTVPFKEGSLAHGGEEDVWRLKGVAVEALRALDDGEWLEILDDEGRTRTSARVIDTHPSAGTLVVGVRTASDPPRAGFVRPRSRKKILEQKRALLEELASPTGSLPNLVRLVAAPASMPTPQTVRPARFVNLAVVRNRSQARAVGLALGLEDGEALLIQGPPGTGKSTTAAEIDVQLIMRDPGVRILVCSHSNHGTDNMLMKVLPFLEDAAERIARIGFYERISREARPFYAGSDVDLSEKNIIFTTIDALVLQDIAGARVYDYVIVDEANRAGVLDSLLALARGRRMVMVGDPMQLQPVMSEAEQQMVASANGSSAGRHGRRGGGQPAMVGVPQPGAQHVIGKSLFAWIQERRFAPAATVLLDQQNRMHPAIGELVSRVFYSNHVRTGPAAPRRGTGLPAFPAPVTWVDTRALKGNVESRAGGTSLFNVAEARLVTSITTHLASHAPPNLTIGVITAYAEQRDLLRRLMGPHTWPADRQLEIDTVDAFEGREKDIIVLSLVRANRRRDIGFLRLEQRLNVAISRSRRLLIVVGDTSTLREGFFGHLIATAQAVGQIIPAPKLIGQFLSRVARPRREREERRREGLPESERMLPAAGELAPSGAEISPDAESAGVPAAATPGQEAPGSVGSRRRRRRAWERRRERLRSLHEQHQHGVRPPGEGDEASDGAHAGGEATSETPALDGAELFDAEGEAAGAGAEVFDAKAEASGAGDALSASSAEATPGPRLRPRRRRFGIPRGEEPSSASIEPGGVTAESNRAGSNSSDTLGTPPPETLPQTPGTLPVRPETRPGALPTRPGALETRPAVPETPRVVPELLPQTPETLRQAPKSLPVPAPITPEPTRVAAGPARRRAGRTRVATEPVASAASEMNEGVPEQDVPVRTRRVRRGAEAASQAVASEPTAERSQAVASEPTADRTQAVASEPTADRTQAVASEPRADRTQAVAPEPRADRTQAVAPEPRADRTQAVASEPTADRTQAVASEPTSETTQAAPGLDVPLRTRRARRTAEPRQDLTVAEPVAVTDDARAADAPAADVPARNRRPRRQASAQPVVEETQGPSRAVVDTLPKPSADADAPGRPSPPRRARPRRTSADSPNGMPAAQPEPVVGPPPAAKIEPSPAAKIGPPPAGEIEASPAAKNEASRAAETASPAGEIEASRAGKNEASRAGKNEASRAGKNEASRAANMAAPAAEIGAAPAVETAVPRRVRLRRVAASPNGTDTLEPATLDPATLDPATLEPATLEPATLEPATLEPATLEPATLEPARPLDAAAAEVPVQAATSPSRSGRKQRARASDG